MTTSTYRTIGFCAVISFLSGCNLEKGGWHIVAFVISLLLCLVECINAFRLNARTVRKSLKPHNQASMMSTALAVVGFFCFIFINLFYCSSSMEKCEYMRTVRSSYEELFGEEYRFDGVMEYLPKPVVHLTSLQTELKKLEIEYVVLETEVKEVVEHNPAASEGYLEQLDELKSKASVLQLNATVMLFDILCWIVMNVIVELLYFASRCYKRGYIMKPRALTEK